MKKFRFLGLILALLCVFALTACVEDDSDDTYTPGITAATEVINLNVGDKLNPLEGVTAIDAKGNNVLSRVEVSHMIPVDENGCVTQSGPYKIKYTLNLDGDIFNLYRDVVVKYVAPITNDLVINGDFESGSYDPFTKSEFDNGAATMSVIEETGGNKVLKFDVTNLSWQQASPRLETNVFTLEAGKYYEVTFKAYAAEARAIYIQLGELLAAAPWFNQLKDEYIEIGTEKEEYKIGFVADPAACDLTKVQLLFGFGTPTKGTGVATQVYIDDIRIDEAKQESLIKANELAEFGEEALAKEEPHKAVVWYDQGGWCGAASTCTSSLVEGTLTLEAAQPEGSCWFATQVFIYSKALESDGVYKVTCTLNSTKAGVITFCNQPVEIAVGDNELTATVEAKAEGQLGFVLQLGTEADGNIGDADITIKDILAVRTGDIVVLEYADPANLFGTPAANIENEGEGVAKSDPNTFYVWYVQSADWQCGAPTTVNYGYEDGVVTIESNLNESNYWYAVQLFYCTKAIKDAGTHTLTFTLNSTITGEVTINGKKTSLVVGDNAIEVPFENGANDQFTLSVQLGWEEIVDGGDNISHQFKGEATLKFSKFAIDGVEAGKPETPPQAASFGTPKEGALVFGEESNLPDQEFVFWNDQNWVGSSVECNGTYANGTLTLNVTSFTGANWFGFQCFYKIPTLPAGTHTLRFNVNATVAGAVTICGKAFNLEQGDNEIEVEINGGSTYNFAFITGVATGSSVGVGTWVLSGFTFEPKQPAASFGTPKEGALVFGEESNLPDQEFVFWNDQNWVGSSVECNGTYANGTLTLNVTSFTGANWFGFQCFYKIPTLPAGTHTLRFNVNATVAGAVTICGKEFNLEQGDNEIEIEINGGSTYNFAFITGVATGSSVGVGTWVLSGFTFEEKEEPAGGTEFTLVEDGTRIEGAGIWIWVDPTSIGMTGANFSTYSVRCEVESKYNLVEAFLSDYSDSKVRVYVVLTGAPIDGENTTVDVTITCGETAYTGTVNFTGTTLLK